MSYVLYQRLLDVGPKYNFVGMRTEVYTSYIHLSNRFSALGPKNDTSTNMGVVGYQIFCFLSLSLTKFGMGIQLDKILAHKCNILHGNNQRMMPFIGIRHILTCIKI